MRFLSLLLVVLSIPFSAEAGPIRVKKEDAIHFMRVVDDMQHLLSAAADDLKTPAGVRKFRDIAEALRLHQIVLEQNKDLEPDEESFSRFLWAANPWVNRNIGIADRSGEGGQSLFALMYANLDTYSDVAISQNEAFQQPLYKAAKHVEGASGLEAVSEPKKADPRGVVIADHDLEMAVAFAALGVATFPARLSKAEGNQYYALPKVESLIYLTGFLKQKEALAVLKKRAKFSVTAATALKLVTGDQFANAAKKIPTALSAEGEGYNRRLTITDEVKFETYTAAMLGMAGIAREEAEDEIKPTKLGLKPNLQVVPKAKAVTGPVTHEEAELLGGLFHHLLNNLSVLNDGITREPMTPNRRAIRNTAGTLAPFFEFLEGDANNHLTRRMHAISHFSFRNYMSMARGEGGQPGLIRRFMTAVTNKTKLDALIKSLEYTDSLESPAGSQQLEIDPASVSANELARTLLFSVSSAAIALQAVPAALVQQVKSPTFESWRIELTLGLLRDSLNFLAAREANLKLILAEAEANTPDKPQVEQLRTAVALIAELGKVQAALTLLENGFKAADATAGREKTRQFAVLAQQVYDLMTALQYPVAAGSDAGEPCLEGVVNVGKARRPQ